MAPHSLNSNKMALEYSILMEDLNPNVSNKSSDYSINLYPNPATDLLYINGQTSKIKSITIFDVQGKLISKKPDLNSEETLSISLKGLSLGIYSVKIITETDVFVQKFIKQ
jgi:hypothetical protein